MPINSRGFFLLCICSALLVLAGCSTNQSLENAAASVTPAPAEVCAPIGSFVPAGGNSTGYGELAVDVRDGGSGQIVRGLTTADFDLASGTQALQVASVEFIANAPQSVGFVIDVSGSMQPKMAQMKSAIGAIVDRLNPGDDVLLVGLAKKPYLLVSGTTDHNLIVERVDGLKAFGRTDLYDGMISGMSHLVGLCFTTKTLVVISDGVDDASVAGNSQVIEQARDDGIQIGAIGIGDIVLNPASRSSLPWSIRAIDVVDVSSLEAITDPTGGRTVHLMMSDDESQLKAAAASIAEGPGVYVVEFARPPGIASNAPVSVAIKGHPDYVIHSSSQ